MLTRRNSIAVEYNVRVWFIGRVDPHSAWYLMAAFNEAHPSPLNGRIPPSVVPEGKPGQTPDNSSSIYRQPYSQYTKQYTNIPFAFTPPFRPQAASEWP